MTTAAEPAATERRPGGAPASTRVRAPRRVALVHDWLTGMRGGEKVLEALASLYPGAPIYTLFHFPGSVSAAIESHPIRTSFLQGAPRLETSYRHYLPLFPMAIADLDLDPYDLVISTSHCVAKSVKTRPDAEHVCYCHTPMRYAWDQRRAYFPGSGPAARLREPVLDWLQRWDARTSDRVDRFVANSSFVAERIRRYYDRDATVVSPPVDVDRFSPAPDKVSRGDYALMVAALSPYKRIDLAIKACDWHGIDLRIVGEGPLRTRLERADAKGLRILGRVSDDELVDLYRRARFLVQPGHEDFGIAAVEALACGTPVVALGEGGVCDIVVDGEHGLLYRVDEDASELAALTESIDKVHKMQFNPLKLRRRAMQFSRARFLDNMRALLAPNPS